MKNYKTIFKLLLLLVFAQKLCFAQQAQVSGGNPTYAFSATSGTFTALSGGTNVASIQTDDGTSASLPLGFNFTFGCNTYTTAQATSNGALIFKGSAGSTAGYNNTSGVFNTGNSFLAPLWDDLNGAGGTATYLTSGTAPNRVFTMEWKNWKWQVAAAGAVESFQVKLYETSNKIEYVYNQNATAVVTGSASIGIISDIAVGLETSSSNLWLNNTSSSPNATTTFVSNLATKPASGQVYSFTPDNNCTPKCEGTMVLNSTGGTAAGLGLKTTISAAGNIQIMKDGVNQIFTSDITLGTTAPYAVAGTISGLALSVGNNYVNSGTLLPTGMTDLGKFDIIYNTCQAKIQNGTSYKDTIKLAKVINGLTYGVNLYYSYNYPNTYITTSYEVVIPPGNIDVVRLSNGWDTKLAGSDAGPGFVSGTAPNLTMGVKISPSYEAFQYVSGVPWSGYYSAIYSNINLNLGTDNTFNNTIDPTTTTDNGIGISMNYGVTPGTFSSVNNVIFSCNAPTTAPTVSATTSTNVCPSTTTNIQTLVTSTLPTGTSFVWRNAADNSIIADPTTISATGTYYVTIKDNASNCESPATNVVVTINPVPNAPTSVAATNSTICVGSTSSLSASCSTGTLTWYNNVGLTTVVTSPVSPSSTTTYYAVCVGTVCKSTAVPITVTVIPIPGDPSAVSPKTICNGSSTTLTGTCTSPAVIKWYSASNLTGLLASTTVSPTSTSTYYAVCMDATLTCKSNTLSEVVTVTTVPAASAASASLNPICLGGSTTLNATCGTGTPKWFDNAALTGTAITNATSVSPTANQDYYAVCDDGTCKSVSTKVSVGVATPPSAPSASPTTICSGGSATLSGTCSAGTLTWYSDSGLTTVISNTPTANATTTYYGACVTATCKSAYTPVTVTVGTISAPSSLSATKTTICSGSTDLTGTCSTGTLVWYPDNTFTTALGSATVSPTITSSYYASCESGACVLHNTTPNVITVVACPVATNDAATYTPGSAKVISVLANDGASITVSSIVISGADALSNGKTKTVLNEGTWTVNSDGTITFTPDSGYSGNPTVISYSGADAAGNVSNTATVTLTASPLYVTLIDFHAQKEEHAIKIVWTTADEINADKFEVMRSADAKLFENIGTVIAKGNSQRQQYYSLTDQNPIFGINYYRLRSIDFDGSVQLSNIVSVPNEPTLRVSIAPNPFVNKITVSSSESIIKAVLFMPNGSQNNLNLHQLGSNVEIEINQNLSAGVYILSLENLKNQIVKYRLVKE